MKNIEPIPALALDDLLSMAASAIEDLLDHCDPNTDYYSGVWADVPGRLRAAMRHHSGDVTDKAEPGWIPVSERLPESNTFVLVSNGVWVGQGAYNDSEHLDADEHWQDEHHEFINLLHHPVTHWQPLPAAPKV